MTYPIENPGRVFRQGLSVPPRPSLAMRYRYERVEGERRTEVLEAVEIPGTEPPRLAFRVDVGNTPPERVEDFLRAVREQLSAGGIRDFLLLPHRGPGTGTEVLELVPIEDDRR